MPLVRVEAGWRGLVALIVAAGCTEPQFDRKAGPDGGPPSGPDSGGAGPWVAVNACGLCTTYGTPEPIAPVPDVLSELSGLAASRVHPDVLYAHNDSANDARFFALSAATGATVAELHLPAASATDWEGIAVGPCPAGSCVYIADIGDNDLRRDRHMIYRFPEPTSLVAGDAGTLTVAYESFSFSYPDGRHNAETVLVHPMTGEVFIVTKSDAGAGVYGFPGPLVPDENVVLVSLGPVAAPPDVGPITDGAFHPCAERVLLRSKTAVLEFSTPVENVTAPVAGTSGARAPAPTSAASILATAPSRMPLAAEPQGEAVTYTADGWGYVTGTEMADGNPPPQLSAVACADR